MDPQRQPASRTEDRHTEGSHTEGRVVSVNVGTVRTVDLDGRQVTTGIFKEPVEGPRAIRGVNVVGDDQADRRVHGGPDKAIYAYAAEDYRWWSAQLDRDLSPGTFGENLTVSGLDLTAAVIGEQWQVGSARLRVTQPRIPCFKLGIRMDDQRFPARFAAAGRPGAYLAVEQEGTVGAEAPVTVVFRPDHGVTVGHVERAYHDDRGLAADLLDVPGLPGGWQDWARRVLARQQA